MIRLTKSGNGEPVYVSPELIVSAEIVDGVTMLNVRSDRIFVTESPSEVARKVLEWRLAMEDYRIYTKLASIDGDYDVANKCYDDLKRLAGLEEQA